MKLYELNSGDDFILLITRAETQTDPPVGTVVGDSRFKIRKGDLLFGLSFQQVKDQLESQNYVEI